MKKVFLASAFVLLSITSVIASDLKVSSFENVKWKWVEVLNKHIESGNNELGLDQLEIAPTNGQPYINNVCGIGGSDRYDQFKNKIKVIGELSDGEYIFEYTREGVAYGTPCPSGVFFKGKLEDFTK